MSAALQFSAGKLMAAYVALTAAAVLPGSFLSKIYKKNKIGKVLKLIFWSSVRLILKILVNILKKKIYLKV